MPSPDWFWFCPLAADTEFLGAPPTRRPTLAHVTSVIELAAEMGFTSLLTATNAHAAPGGRSPYGLRCHVLVRETEAEAWAAAERLVSRVDPAVLRQFLEAARNVDSTGQRRQVELSSGPSLVVEPNLWAGVGLARTGVGVALVGDPAQIEAKLRSYLALGFSTFILSGYPHWEECRRFGELVLPRFRGRGAGATGAALGAPEGVAPVT
jgi:alkanesulfonate monooxygenase